MRIWMLPVLLMLGCADPGPLAAQDRREVAPFRSVALSDGGRVVIRYGAAPSVTVTEGYADVSVEEGRLRIGPCHACPRVHARRIEVVAPALDSLSVDNGGRIEVEAGFPRQAQLAASVSHGGAIDARRLDAAHVTASVAQGGMIFTRPGERLDASVSQGGAVTYWGEPAVRRSVRHGGVIVAGRPADVERPIEELGTLAQPPHPPVPPGPKRSD